MNLERMATMMVLPQDNGFDFLRRDGALYSMEYGSHIFIFFASDYKLPKVKELSEVPALPFFRC